jgi:hypothetical protein
MAEYDIAGIDLVRMEADERCRVTVEEPDMSRKATPASSDETTAEARQRMVDSLTLQYDFDGIDIAYRRTPQGVEVVAVGLEEVGELIRTTSQEQREGVVFGQG